VRFEQLTTLARNARFVRRLAEARLQQWQKTERAAVELELKLQRMMSAIEQRKIIGINSKGNFATGAAGMTHKAIWRAQGLIAVLCLCASMVQSAPMPAPTGLAASVPALPALTIAPPATNRGTISLAWNATADTNAIGYCVYLGFTNTANPWSYDVGKKISVTIGGLVEGTTYRCYLSSYDATGAESMRSNEIKFICPARTTLRHDRVAIESYGVTGRTNAMQETTNLINWTDALVWVGDGKLRGIVRTNYAGTKTFYRTVPR
jgi:hypothetical protein